MSDSIMRESEQKVLQAVARRVENMPTEFRALLTRFKSIDQLFIAMAWKNFETLMPHTQKRLESLAKVMQKRMPEIIADLPNEVVIYFVEDANTTAKRALDHTLPHTESMVETLTPMGLDPENPETLKTHMQDMLGIRCVNEMAEQGGEKLSAAQIQAQVLNLVQDMEDLMVEEDAA